MKVQDILIADIKVGKRRREDYGEIQELADSIARHGLIQPIVVDAGLNLVAGGRRLRACQSLGWADISARFYAELSEEELREIELEENVRRKDLNPYERSKKWVELADTSKKIVEKEFSGVTPKKSGRGRPPKPDAEEKVAERLGVDRKTITNARQHVAAVEKYPELAAPGIPQKDAITIAKNLDELPDEKRSEVRSRFIAGDSNVKATLAGKPPLPPPLTKQKAPSDKWGEKVADLRKFFYGLRQFGGAAKLTSNWTPEQVQAFTGELVEFRAELDTYISELQESQHELSVKVG